MTAAGNRERLPIGTIADIPTNIIRPFRGQPRKYFDPEKLKLLAASITSEGQKTPGWLEPVYDDPIIQYELTAGERRWRACEIAGKTFRAEIRKPGSSKQKYFDSITENFGREDCNHLESARAIAEVIRLEFGENPTWGQGVAERVSTIFTQTVWWVNQHRMLLRLHPEVQAMMEPTVPKEKQLNFQVAISLANLKPDVQLKYAKHIQKKGLTFKKALAYVRSHVDDSMRIKKNGPSRRPSADYDILVRFLRSLGEQAETLLDLPRAKFEEMFRHRPEAHLSTVIKVIRQRRKQLEVLQQVLERVATPAVGPILVERKKTGT